MKKIIIKGVFFLTMIAIALSCQKETLHQNNNSEKGIIINQSSESEDLIKNEPSEKSGDCNECTYNVFSYNIIVSNMNIIGTMKVTNNSSKYFMTFKTVNGWKLSEIHVFGGNIANLPVLNGNINPNGFNVNQVFSVPTHIYSFNTNINNLPSSCLSIVATGIAVDGYGNYQQFWVYGIQLPNTKFVAWYNTYCIQVCSSKS